MISRWENEEKLKKYKMAWSSPSPENWYSLNSCVEMGAIVGQWQRQFKTIGTIERKETSCSCPLRFGRPLLSSDRHVLSFPPFFLFLPIFPFNALFLASEHIDSSHLLADTYSYGDLQLNSSLRRQSEENLLCCKVDVYVDCQIAHGSMR